jgi:hypothetical protein
MIWLIIRMSKGATFALRKDPPGS